jgi:hypothetical protein
MAQMLSQQLFRATIQLPLRHLGLTLVKSEKVCIFSQAMPQFVGRKLCPRLCPSDRQQPILTSLVGSGQRFLLHEVF